MRYEILKVEPISIPAQMRNRIVIQRSEKRENLNTSRAICSA